MCTAGERRPATMKWRWLHDLDAVDDTIYFGVRIAGLAICMA